VGNGEKNHFSPSFFLVVSGCISTSSNKPDWVHEIKWSGDIQKDREIETLLWDHIEPYKSIEYDILDISTIKEGNAINIRISAISNQSPYMDIYDFTYDDNKLVMTGYLLEAIPPSERRKAIWIAVSNTSIKRAVADAKEPPSVRRILPDTSEKFYKPRTLMSVTWKDVGHSALVDIDTQSVVNIWSRDNDIKQEKNV
jgi:hypothetical protein